MNLIQRLNALIVEWRSLAKGGDTVKVTIDTLQFVVDCLTAFHGTPGPKAHVLDAVAAAEPMTDAEIQGATAEDAKHLVGGPIADAILIARLMATLAKYAPEVWAIVAKMLHKGN